LLPYFLRTKHGIDFPEVFQYITYNLIKSTTTPKKGGLLLTLKGSLTSHPSTMHSTYGASRALRALRESKFSHDKQKIAYLAPWGVQSRYAGLCMGKVLEGKKNAFFFP